MVDMEAELLEQGRAKVIEMDNQGRAAFEQEDFSQARRWFEQAAEVCRAIGWREELIYQLLHITQAMARELVYDPSTAQPLLDEALQVAQATGQPRWILPVQINRIRLSLSEGRYAAGLRLAQANLPTAVTAGFDDFAGSILQFAAYACVALERYEVALRLHSAAQAQRDREGTIISDRKVRETMERNLIPARKAFPAGKRAAIEAMGYQMSLVEVSDYLLSIEVTEE